MPVTIEQRIQRQLIKLAEEAESTRDRKWAIEQLMLLRRGKGQKTKPDSNTLAGIEQALGNRRR